MVNRFGIYSPTLGVRQDFPSILMNKAITHDNRNVQIWQGEIRKTKLRTPELLKTIHSVDTVDTSANTVSILGNVVSHFPNGSSVTIYDSDDNYQTFTLSTTSQYNSTSTVLTATTSITVSTAQYVFNAEDVGSSDPTDTDFRKVAFPDGNPAMDYRRLLLSDGTERLCGFTKDNIYYWDSTLTKWVVIHTCASSCSYWSISIYGDNICATNNIDRPIYWDGNTANTFENLDTQYNVTSDYVAKAKYIATYHNYIFLINVELSDGERYKDYAFWSNIGEGVDSQGFRQGLGGDAGYATIPGTGELTGVGYWQGNLIFFKSLSIQKMWFVGGDIPFSQDELFADIGCNAPGSIGNDWEGRLYFYGSDKYFREITEGIISDAVIDTGLEINPEYLSLIRFHAVDEYNELRWAIPYGNTATANNKIVVYKPREKRWDTDIDIAVTAFGRYSRQTNLAWYTLPYDSWLEWGWASWDSVAGQSDYPIDICSDADGFTYDLHGGYLDNGDEYDSYFVISTDLADKQALPLYKRILQIYVYVRKESTGTLTLSVKRDSESSYQSLGSVALTGSGDILRKRLAVDVRGRHFMLKCLGTSYFRVIGFEFEWLPAGDR